VPVPFAFLGRADLGSSPASPRWTASRQSVVSPIPGSRSASRAINSPGTEANVATVTSGTVVPLGSVEVEPGLGEELA
jgi:hypothetical protein